MIWDHEYPPGFLRIAAGILVAMGLNAAVLTIRDVGGVDLASRPWTALALVAAGLAAVLAGAALHPRGRMGALRGVALAALGAALLATVVPHDVTARAGVPWTLHLAFVGMVAAGVCLRGAWLLLYGLLMLNSVWRLSEPTLGAASLLLVVAIGAFLLAFVKERILAVTAATQQANRRAAAASIDATRTTAADAARDQRNAWVHDHLLVVLRLGSQRSPGAAELATELVASGLHGPEAGASDLRQSAREVAAGQGVRLQWELTGGNEAPPAVLKALDCAIGEAIRNAARHSGVGVVAVSGEVTATRAHVAVTDAGSGFEPQATAAGRLGVRTSILAQMEAAGGWAEVLSEPGAGTQVRLGWRASVDPDPTLDLPLGRVVAAAAGLTTIAAARAWLGVAADGGGGWVIAGFVVLIVLTVWMTFRPASVSWVLGSWLVASAALAVTAPAMADAETRHWFALGSAVLFIAAARARRERLGLAFAAATFVANLAFAALLRPPSVAAGWAYWVQPMIYATLAWAGIAQFERLLRDHRDASRRAITLEEAVIRAEAEQDEAERWRAGVPARVEPLLEELSTASSISPDLARRCAITEAATRDYLTAPRLVTPDLAAMVASVRESGTYVSLTDGGPHTTAAELRAVRAGLRLVAPLAGPRSRLTVHRTVRDPTCFATITVTRPRPGVGHDLSRLPGAEVFADADTVHLRLTTTIEEPGAGAQGGSAAMATQEYGRST